MNFYRTFIRLCNENKKAPTRVALDVGVSKPAVSRWKQGSMPSDRTIQKLADYFNVDFDYLKYGNLPGIGDAAYAGRLDEVMRERIAAGLILPEAEPEKKLQTAQTPEAMREAVVRFWADTATDDMIRDFFYIAFGAHGSDIQAQLKELAVLDHVPLDYRVSVVKNIITFYNLAQARGELVCEDLAPANLHVLVEAIRAGLNAVGEGRDSYIQAGE